MTIRIGQLGELLGIQPRVLRRLCTLGVLDGRRLGDGSHRRFPISRIPEIRARLVAAGYIDDAQEQDLPLFAAAKTPEAI